MTNETTRPFEVMVNIPSRVFVPAEGAYLFANHPLRSGARLEFEMLSEASSIQPFHVLKCDHYGCFSFVPVQIEAKCLGTAVLLTYPSWKNSLRNRSLKEGEVFVSFRHEELICFSSLNKLSLITCGVISERLHGFFTMM